MTTPTTAAPRPSELARLWQIDPAVTFLNHGSFGACPTAVLDAQTELRARMERQPLRFFIRDLESMLDGARGELAAFVGVDPSDLVFVSNATTGVNTVLRSLELRAGDEILTTDHAYGACKNALDDAADRAGARVIVAPVPFPLGDPSEVTRAIARCVTARTRFALIDHVTSQTALVFPIREIVGALTERGVDTMVDGAHALGMFPLDVRAIGAAYYTANCHKWLCAPKGSAFLHVRRDRQRAIRPLSISHGRSSPRVDRSRLLLEFDWTGTTDPTPFLCIPVAIRFLSALRPGGFAELMEDNRAAVLAARKRLCDALGVAPPCPDGMTGAMTSIPLPDGSREPPRVFPFVDSLQDALLARYGIEVPVFPWPAAPKRLLRISAQAYNMPADYQRLASALGELLAG